MHIFSGLRHPTDAQLYLGQTILNDLHFAYTYNHITCTFQ